MKITQILLQNFATVNEIKIDLTDTVTYLVGENGSGKTTCGLNAIWFILEGIAKTGKKALHADRFRFIGKYGKSAVGQITLHDEKEDIEIYLQRKLTKNGTTFKMQASDGRDLGPDFVDKIFNIFSINPEGFAQLTPKDQATALGVNTAAIDAKKAVVYDQRRELGYAVKQTAGALEENGEAEVEKVKSVDIQELIDRKARLDRDNEENQGIAQGKREELYRAAIAHNKVQAELQREEDGCRYALDVSVDQVVQLKKDIATTEANIEKQKRRLVEMLADKQPVRDTDIPMPEFEVHDMTGVSKEIDEAQEQNRKAAAWVKYEDLRKRHAAAVALRDKKDTEYRGLEADRVAYLKSCNLPFSNITINDGGELEVDGRPFNRTYFSKGEILRAGIKMAAATNPELKYIFVPDAQSIDEASRETLFAELTEAGFQVVAEVVGTQKKEGENSILLRESRIVDNYDDKKSVL